MIQTILIGGSFLVFARFLLLLEDERLLLLLFDERPPADLKEAVDMRLLESTNSGLNDLLVV